jgi:ABC-type sugar transport system ATPase subunit
MTPGLASPPADGTALLEVSGLGKTFPGGQALSDATLSIGSGEIVAVVGQNGSGKSTLVKLLAGVHKPDPGAEIRYRGEPLELHGGGGALHFIHQDLGLIPLLSTVENLSLGADASRPSWKPNRRDEKQRARKLIARFDASFDVTVPIAELSAAERTIVAIARALDGWERGDNVLVLDEPTATLHGEEVAKLISAVRRVAERGAGVLFISHRLDEVQGLADRVIVLRNGKVVGSLSRGGFDHEDLVRLMTGTAVAGLASDRRGVSSDVVLRATGVCGGVVADVDLSVRAGEIVGVTGIMGSGREQLAGLLFGARRRTAGEVTVNGAKLRSGDPVDAIGRSVAFVPADRHRHGAVLSHTARENLTLAHQQPLRRRFGRLDRRTERAQAREWMERVEVDPLQPEREMALFSGGNQQKVVIAKWLRAEPVALLLDDPTQGVDVGAKATIYELIRGAARRGTAVLLASSETKDLTEVCDRVLVLRDGRLVAEFDRASVTEARLVEASLGLRDGESDGVSA